MSLEGIREAYASIYSNQEQEVLDENPIDFLKGKFKTGADQIGGFFNRFSPGPGSNRAFSSRGAGRAAFRDANIPSKDPVPAPAPRTVRGQGNRELRRPGDPGRTSQPTTRIKPKTPSAAAPTTSGSGSGTTGSGSGSTGGGTSPTIPSGNSAASVNPGFERRTPTGPELRAAQAARAAAPKVLPFKDIESKAVAAGVGVAKGTVKDPKIATDAARKAELASIRQAAKAETMAKADKPTYRSGRQRMRMMDSYDMVLDYLLSEGHADTVEEAHYIMMQLDQEHIQEVVEAYVVTNADKRGNTKAYQNYKAGMKSKIDGKPLYVAAPHLRGV
tara:strand:- start:82 stop:1074 length:993 start_codon:yes stop_codon:yes gene_type:complete